MTADIAWIGLAPRPQSKVRLDRRELERILGVYGRLVAAGELRDYAIDDAPDHAAFSMYRRTSENPLYRVEKRPALANRQGAWALIGPGGQVLKRGHELRQVLDLLERKLLKALNSG
jgi:hypothetical protein